MTLRIAIAGTGSMAAMHARAIQAQPEAELCAVAGHTRERLRKFAAEFNIPRAYDSLDDLISMRAADALVIATPNYLHASQAIQALQAGLHVLIERPLGLDLAQARAISGAAEFSGALLMMAHVYRFDPQVIWLREQVLSGRLGPVLRSRSLALRTSGPVGGAWYKEKRHSGGGALTEAGLDALDTLRFILGNPNPVSVFARLEYGFSSSEVEDGADVLVQWEDGSVSTLGAAWHLPYAEAPLAFTEVYGRDGYGQVYPAFVQVRTEEGFVREDPGFQMNDPHPSQALYDRQMEYFIKCIQLNYPPLPGACEGALNQQILDAAYTSARTKQAVKVRVKT